MGGSVSPLGQDVPVGGHDRDGPEASGRHRTERVATGNLKGTYMTQKRLLALVGAFAIIAAACGGSSATQAPGGSPAASGSSAPSESAAASGNLAAEQVLRLYLASEDPHSLDPAIAETADAKLAKLAEARTRLSNRPSN